MLDSVDGYSGFDPAGGSVGVVVPAVGILIDGVCRIGVSLLYLAPRPRPREIGEIVFLLCVSVDIDRVKVVKVITFKALY